MANPVEGSNDFLRKALYIFDLPRELLLSLRSRSVHNTSPEVEKHIQEPRASIPRIQDDGIPSSTSCAVCHAFFQDVTEQREHARSDFHRYNLKLKLKGALSVDEATFNRLVGDLDESLSGSESSEPDSEDEDKKERSQDLRLDVLLKRQAKISSEFEDGESEFKRRKGDSGSPLFWLSSSQLPENTSLGIYKALFREPERDQDPVEVIKRKQLEPIHGKHSGSSGSLNPQHSTPEPPHYFLCMIGGGHFAAMVVSLAPEIRRGPGGQEERHAIVKAHKTFHRYTTRRKQGGSQSANDNSKGNAHSAGSSIRRYNEMALEVDVRGVLSEWKSMIDSSDLIFIRATGTMSRRTLYGPYEGQVIRANDARIRGFPFNTRRPTQAELMRSFTELTKMKVSTVSRSALEAVAAAEHEEISQPVKQASPSRSHPPKPSKEDEAALMHTSQIQTLIRRSKAPALLTYLTNNNLSPNFTFFPPNTPQHHHAPSPLHLAASNNSPPLVLALLTKAKADATLVNRDGKTAFDIAGDTRTRDAFRVARYLLGEAAVEWKAAHVPSALSEQEAETRQQKEKLEQSAAEAERRKADLARLRQQEDAQKLGKIENKAGAGHSLGSRDKTGAEKREEEGRGLTPEMRMRLDRERRARAAEERIRKMQGNG